MEHTIEKFLKNCSMQTKMIHAGQFDDNNKRAMIPPLYFDSAFGFTNVDDAINAISKGKGDFYSRFSNPNTSMLEKKLALMENVEDCMVTSTGMSAVLLLIFAVVQGPGKENIVIDKYMYFEITAMLTLLCEKMAVELRIIDVTNDEELLKALDEETKLVFIETPTNPLQKVIGIGAVSVKVKRHAPNAKFVVDNTMLSPYFQDCFKHGADMALYSITKHIAGHGDVMGGYITGSEELIQKSRKIRNLFGIIMRSQDAWLTMRGLKTFALRMEKQEKNTDDVYEYLKKHHLIKKIYTTRDKAREDIDIIESQQTGHGSMLVIEIDGDRDKCEKFMRELKLFRIATTFGNIESIVYHSRTFAPPRIDLAPRGENDRMIRLSIGLENEKDIIRDLDNALNTIK